MVVLPWVGLGLALMTLRDSPAPPPLSTASSAADPIIEVGPWGQLELTTVIIEPPDDLITLDARRVSAMPWVFPGYSVAQLTQLFTDTPLADEQRAALLDRKRWELRHDRIVVTVPKSLILALSPDSRRRLYAALAPFRENAGQWAPASFRSDRPADWFAHSGLSDHTKALVQPLLYRRGNALLFSDLELILADVETQRQRLLLLRTLARSTTQFAKLRLTPETDLNEVAHYWATGQRSRDIEPLLRSFPRDGAGFSFDIIHLLPPIARRFVYTYDTPPPPGREPFRDCHWTALNFNKTEPDDSFAEITKVRETYQRDYLPVTDEPHLGDIYLFVAPDETVLHASVHIAGDLVFTKNGVWPGAPWVLMRLSDLVDHYPSDTPIDIQHLRRRD